MTGPRGGRPSRAQLEARQVARAAHNAPPPAPSPQADAITRPPERRAASARGSHAIGGARVTLALAHHLPPVESVGVEWRPWIERAHVACAAADRELPPGATAAMRSAARHAATADAIAGWALARATEEPDGAVAAAWLGLYQRLIRAAAQQSDALLRHRREGVGLAAAQADDLQALLHAGAEAPADEEGDPRVH